MTRTARSARRPRPHPPPRRRVARTAAPLLAAGLAALLVLGPAAGAGAQEFRRWAETARGLGLGGALTAVARGSDATFYNPAGLVQDRFWKVEAAGLRDESEDDPEGFFDQLDELPGTSAEVDRLLNDGRDTHTRREQGWATFHNGSGFGIGAIDTRNRQSRPLTDGIAYHEEGFTGGQLTFAWASELRLAMWGLNVRYLERDVVDEDFTRTELEGAGFDLDDHRSTGRAWTYDLGVLFRLPIPLLRPTLGVSFLNGNDPDFGQDQREPLRSELNVGLALNPQPNTDLARWLILLEMRDVAENAFPTERQEGKRVHAGLELSLFPLDHELWGLQLRGGVSQGYLSYGVGVNLAHYLSIDLASYGEELGNADAEEEERRTVAQIKLGF